MVLRGGMRRGGGGFGGGPLGGRGGGGGEPGDAPPNVYLMQQRMFSIGDDFWITRGDGERAFRVDGKALRIRQTLVLESPAGDAIYRIQEKILPIRQTMDIEGASGPVATVQKALITPLRQRFHVTFASGAGEWEIQGNILDHEYTIASAAGPVATVGKRWFRVRDTYGIEIADGQDAAMVCAVAIVVDSLAHSGR